MLIQTVGENKPEEWFASGFGRWVLAQEVRYCRLMSGETFGFYAVQLGHRRRLTLRAPVRNHAVVGLDGGCDIVADWTALPFAAESVDFILLAHALEASGAPHAVLREAARVLRPRGRMLIVGFNPWSLLGARLAAMPWRGDWISLMRVKDWLALLNMSADEGRFAVFMPPHERRRRKRFGWLEKAGRRWWPLGGGVYFLSAVKRTHGMRMIGRLRRRRLPSFRAPSKAGADGR
ncbi:MAG: class I SAM-dependent methyltransferase [Gammaproteobacteria bacterium]